MQDQSFAQTLDYRSAAGRVDKRVVVTKVLKCTPEWNDKWSNVLVCEFETEDRKRLTVRFAKSAIEALAMDPKGLPECFGPSSDLQKL
jgi:hypothetical protein